MPMPASEQVEAGRLEQDDGVGEMPGAAGGERAVAGALLLDHGEHREVARDRVRIDSCTRFEREPAHGEAGLHVAAAAAVQPAVAPHRLERRRRPLREVTRGHDVDVAVEQQRRPRVAAGATGDDVVAALVGELRDPGDRIGPDVGRDGDAVDLEATGGEPTGEHLECLLLATDRRVGAHQLLEEGERLLGVGVDRARRTGCRRHPP